jgi:hypothetical protein
VYNKPCISAISSWNSLPQKFGDADPSSDNQQNVGAILVLQYHAIPKRRFLEIGLPKSPWVEKICFNTIQTGHKWSNFG